jgi:uncharacterized protein YoaH (UPF0181 family)
MSRGDGQRVAGVVRRKAVRSLQKLLAAGIDDSEAGEQVAEQFNVSSRTAHTWLRRAYEGLSKDVNVPREELLGLALKRRRVVMARAAKDGDWKTVLAAAESEARLLGLNAPVQTEHHVVMAKVQDMSDVMLETVKEFFGDDVAGRGRFVTMLRARVNARLAVRPEKATIVIEAEGNEVAPGVSGSDEPVHPPDTAVFDDASRKHIDPQDGERDPPSR